MFGRYTETISTVLAQEKLRFTINLWSEENNLKQVKAYNNIELYRFGSPLLSNPIYIQLQLLSGEIRVTGWVQTLIPFLRWKLVPVTDSGIGTSIDYRRKGGLFCYKLRELLA